MDYSFNASVAEKYGVNEAVFIHNLYWWIMKNEANGRHYYDGRNWTYNTVEAMAKLFPFWSRDQIRRITERLVKDGAVLKGNYNASSYDRTCWYALSDEVLDLYQYEKTANSTSQYSQFHLANLPNQNGKNAEPIPDSKPDSKPDNKSKDSETKIPDDFSPEMKEVLTEWFTYKKERGDPYKPTGLKIFFTLVRNKLKEHQTSEVIALIHESIGSNYKGITWDKLGRKKPEQQERKWRSLD